MATFIQVKRKCGNLPPDGLILTAPKRHKSIDNPSIYFKYCQTFSEKDPLTPESLKACYNKDQAFQTTQQRGKKRSNLSSEAPLPQASKIRKVTFDSKDDDTPEVVLYDIIDKVLNHPSANDMPQAKKETITCNGEPMTEVKSDDKYVVDVFVNDNPKDSNFISSETLDDDDYYMKYDYTTPTFGDEFDSEGEQGEDSDDSNAENNWRNDYPDEDSDDEEYDEEMSHTMSRLQYVDLCRDRELFGEDKPVFSEEDDDDDVRSGHHGTSDEEECSDSKSSHHSDSD